MVRSLEDITKDKKMVCIYGPTASGKSRLAMQLALALGGEIVNCDSVQVYKDFDIGSAKPSLSDYNMVPHHLFDIISFTEDYDANLFAQDARAVINEISSRGKLPIMVGGTGLYFRALLRDRFHEQLPKDEKLRSELELLSNQALLVELTARNPQRAEQLHINDRYRLLRAVELSRLLPDSGKSLAKAPAGDWGAAFKIYVCPSRSSLHHRINGRVTEMLSSGLVDEVKSLLAAGCSVAAKPMNAIGYKQVCQFLRGELEQSDLEASIQAATRQYAKRQITWFKKMPNDLQLSSIAKNVCEDLVAQVAREVHP